MNMSSEQVVSQLFDLSGRTALITGASGYLGAAMAAALAEAGANVACASRDQNRADSAAKGLPSTHGQEHFGVVLDHFDESSLEQGLQRVIERAGRVDVLVNNGQRGPANDLTDVTPEQFKAQLANAAGYFHLARLVRDHAVERAAPATVVMIGSMYGLVGSYPDAYKDICSASPVAYHALKGGVIHMTRHLAVYWAKDRVRVNCLSPGAFPNPVTVPEGLVDRLTSKCPMGRMGLAHELKGAVVFLASDASSYMTGQNLVIDGGWTAW
ncbi:MAG: SDR family oxidoreductase [Planctomycetales bacterium]|nr:SDR family oxidoreductase [Planctomycetales bacterium]